MQTPELNTKDWSLALAGLITRTEITADRALLDALRQRLSTPDLLDKKQAADFLTIAVRTLDDWRQAKLSPCIERGGYIRFRREDLETFLDTHTLEARKESPYRPRRKRPRHKRTLQRKFTLSTKAVLLLGRLIHVGWTVFWQLALRWLLCSLSPATSWAA